MKEIAAAILIQNQKILICQRKEDTDCALLWEFPGGKREEGESYEMCVQRECREELGIEIEILKEFAQIDYQYPSGLFHFVFYLCTIAKGIPQKMVHKEICWVNACDLLQYPFCPADEDIVKRLRIYGEEER